MKFQNPSFNFFLNGRTNKRTDGRTSRKQYAPHFFKVGGIKIPLLTFTIRSFLSDLGPFLKAQVCIQDNGICF